MLRTERLEDSKQPSIFVVARSLCREKPPLRDKSLKVLLNL